MHFPCKGLYRSPHNLWTLAMANCRSCPVTSKRLHRRVPSSCLLPAEISAITPIPITLALGFKHEQTAYALKGEGHCLLCLHSYIMTHHCLFDSLPNWTLFLLFFNEMTSQNKSKGGGKKASHAFVFMLMNKHVRNQRCQKTFEIFFSSLPVRKC